MSARAWCFTEYALATEETTVDTIPVHDKERYVIYQLERCPDTGRLHLQGYVEFSSQMRQAAVKKWLPTAHLSVRIGTAAQARDYCMKPESRVAGPWERGTFGGKQGKRNDLVAFMDDVKTGMTGLELIETHAKVFANHPIFVVQYQNAVIESKIPKLPVLEWYSWQLWLLNQLDNVPHSRQIIWICDSQGNRGKSYLSKWLVQNRDAFYCNGGKHTDITYAYRGHRIAIFDFVRDAQDYVSYGPIEQIKNGLYFSAKYQSAMRVYDTPHVVIMANFEPNYNSMSMDRWVVVNLDSQQIRYYNEVGTARLQPIE